MREACLIANYFVIVFLLSDTAGFRYCCEHSLGAFWKRSFILVVARLQNRLTLVVALLSRSKID